MDGTTFDRNSSISLNLLTLTLMVAAAAVVGAIILIQVTETDQPSLTLVSFALLLPAVAAKRLLGEKLSLVFGDLLAVCAAVLFGPAPAVMVVVANRLMASIGMKDGYRRSLYNVASCAVSMNAAIYATLALFPSFGESPAEMSAGELSGAIALSAVGYFMLSLSLMTAYEALSNDESFFALLKASFVWTSVRLLLRAPSALTIYLRQWNYDEGRHHKKSRVGERLVARGLITQDDLQVALKAQREVVQPGKRLGEILIDMGLIEERHVADALAA